MMSVAELKVKISKHQLPNFLIFIGEDIGILDTYLDRISSTFNGTTHKLDFVSEAVSLCSSNSLIVKNKLIIISDDIGFTKNSDAWGKIKDLIGKNTLILKYHSCDKRTLFWKKFSDDTVFFDKMSISVISKHLGNEYNVDPIYVRQLAEGCSKDYYRSRLEMDKVKNFSEYNNLSMKDALNKCYENNVLCLDKDISILNFANALLKRNFSEAINLYRSLVESDEPLLKILSVLYTCFKNVLIAQTMCNYDRSSMCISYNSYLYACSYVGKYQTFELENILYTLMTLEQQIKTGKINPEIVIDFLLLNL